MIVVIIIAVLVGAFLMAALRVASDLDDQMETWYQTRRDSENEKY